MQTVYKYLVQSVSTTIQLPADACVRHAGVQGNSIYLWIELDLQAPRGVRRFEVYGTGWPVDQPDTLTFVGTVQMPSRLVFHIYERSVGTDVDPSKGTTRVPATD